jgi:hypothetical protein
LKTLFSRGTNELLPIFITEQPLDGIAFEKESAVTITGSLKMIGKISQISSSQSWWSRK